MNNIETIQALYDRGELLDILIGIEEYFDNIDLYAYKNWIDGEIVQGPDVSKYMVEIVLKFTAKTLPDPRALLMFEKHGTIIKVMKDYEVKPLEKPRGVNDMEEVPGGNGSAAKMVKEIREPILLVKFIIPRRLVNSDSFNEYKLMIADEEGYENDPA